MAKMENNEIKNSKLIPRLRFPGFEGEWEYVNGNELFEPISNKNHNSDLPILALTQEQGAVPRDEINYKVIVSDRSVAGYKVVEVDDFIISLRSFQGGIEYSRYKGLCSPAYIVLRKKLKGISSDFYRIYFKSFNYIQALNKNLEGIRDGKMISYSQFSEIKLPKPSFSEQQKIASCLSELDNLIAAQGQKVDALKEKKKGLLQQLFPQPGETTPRLRFPGFEGEWEEKKFKDFTFSSGQKNKQNLPYERYSISNETGFCPQNDQFEGGGGYLKNIDCRMYIIVSPKSFAYNPARINVGSIGYQNLGKEVIVSSLYEVFQTTDICDDTFLWHWFKSNVFRKMVVDVQEGGVRQYFYYNKLQECSIYLPTLSEQQKIASCLSSLDDLIATESAKVEVLKDHKKGLMQQLFPQGSEISRFSNTDARECDEPLGDARECDTPRSDELIQQTSKY